MNGAQDLGGMMGFGPIAPERDEPVFHAEWERRAFALTLAAGFTGQWNIDVGRSARESMPPARYLASSYYQIWLDALERMLLARGMITSQELAAGRALQPARPEIRATPASEVPALLLRGGPSLRASEAAPRFVPGQRVRARIVNPAHHTRLPRYLRGRTGVIAHCHGVHVFPDSNAQGLGEAPQPLYTVRFAATEVWGEDTTAESVCADLWESYLELAPAR
jgi:nitrile hydratase beta subunit